MTRVERIDNLIDKMSKPPLSLLGSIDADREDCVLICAGFEDRAVEVLKRLVTAGSNEFLLIVVSYLPAIEMNKFDEIERICQKNGIRMISLVYDRQDPSGAGDRILSLLSAIHGRIMIDISAMSRLLITQTIVALGTSRRSFQQTNILYSEAEGYPPSREQVDQVLTGNTENSFYRGMFLSSGVFNVVIIPELSSVALQGEPLRLVCFPSFNRDQLDALRGELQPASYTVIHGAPPLQENVWRLEGIRRLNQTDSILGREEYEVSTLDYRETLACLVRIYQEHGATERLVISPTGSKMQAVATGLFRTFMNDVRIAYPVPRQFAAPSDYTIGVRTVYCLNLDPFSSLHQAGGRRRTMGPGAF